MKGQKRRQGKSQDIDLPGMGRGWRPPTKPRAKSRLKRRLRFNTVLSGLLQGRFSNTLAVCVAVICTDDAVLNSRVCWGFSAENSAPLKVR